MMLPFYSVHCCLCSPAVNLMISTNIVSFNSYEHLLKINAIWKIVAQGIFFFFTYCLKNAHIVLCFLVLFHNIGCILHAFAFMWAFYIYFIKSWTPEHNLSHVVEKQTKKQWVKKMNGWIKGNFSFLYATFWNHRFKKKDAHKQRKQSKIW